MKSDIFALRDDCQTLHRSSFHNRVKIKQTKNIIKMTVHVWKTVAEGAFQCIFLYEVGSPIAGVKPGP